MKIEVLRNHHAVYSSSVGSYSTVLSRLSSLKESIYNLATVVKVFRQFSQWKPLRKK